MDEAVDPAQALLVELFERIRRRRVDDRLVRMKDAHVMLLHAVRDLLVLSTVRLPKEADGLKDFLAKDRKRSWCHMDRIHKGKHLFVVGGHVVLDLLGILEHVARLVNDHARSGRHDVGVGVEGVDHIDERIGLDK